MKKNIQKYLPGFIIVLILFLVLVLISQNPSNKNSEISEAGAMMFNFGDISMGNGKVSHRFELVNDGAKPIAISKIYTSCMCTSAMIITDGGQEGPFGMPGHGFMPRVNTILAPSEKAIVEVVFDPAAHGPAGVGKIERSIYVETDDSERFVFSISAVVTP